jgi:hypothetical protein
LAAPAAAQSLPVVNLGFTSFGDGSPFAGPGLYFEEYFLYFGANQFRDAAGNVLPLPSPRLNVFASASQLVYLSNLDLPLLHAKPFAEAILPVVWPDLDFGAPGPFPTVSGNGLGDLIIGPGLQFDTIKGPHGVTFAHRLEAEFLVPIGRYSNEHEINPGAGFYSFDPYWAGTLSPTPRIKLSYRAHYLWNARNTHPDQSLGVGSTTAGQAFHINFAGGYDVLDRKLGDDEQHLLVGVNGYWLKQTTDAEFNGNAVPGFREQVLGIGPGMVYSPAKGSYFFVNVYLESDVRNRPEGTRLTVRYIKKF